EEQRITRAVKNGPKFFFCFVIKRAAVLVLDARKCSPIATIRQIIRAPIGGPRSRAGDEIMRTGGRCWGLYSYRVVGFLICTVIWHAVVYRHANRPIFRIRRRRTEEGLEIAFRAVASRRSRNARRADRRRILTVVIPQRRAKPEQLV